jgi:hypothetical protein
MTSNLSDEQLITLNQRGLIPGTNENEMEFSDRVKITLRSMEILEPHFSTDLPFSPTDRLPPEELSNSFAETKRFYDIKPDWTLCFYNSDKLVTWQGGSTWIIQLGIGKPTLPIVQIHERFKKTEFLYGLYSKKEILTHELVHAGRSQFNEPIFEEFLAYRTSASGLRRWLGPILQSQYEAFVFVFTLLTAIALDFASFWVEDPNIQSQMQWGYLGPFILIYYALIRMWMRHWNLNRCTSRLSKAINSDEKANYVSYRLTDEEIKLFAFMSPEKINEYAVNSKDLSLRWRVIYNSYFM